jgi:ABC-2 type transport system permease protein
MKMRRILAVLKKQFKDTRKNKSVLLQFILFPMMAIIFTYAVQDDTVPSTWFATLFATMFVGMAPLASTAAVISEEKEKNTLRVLIMSNVKPMEYLLAIAIYTFLMCLLGTFVFAVVCGYTGATLLRFVLAMICGIIASLLVGAAIGVRAPNQMAASSLTVVFSLIFSFVPMIAIFNPALEKISRILYTQQVNYLTMDLSAGNFTWDRFAIIGINMVIFAAAFVVSYKKGNLAE